MVDVFFVFVFKTIDLKKKAGGGEWDTIEGESYTKSSIRLILIKNESRVDINSAKRLVR